MVKQVEYMNNFVACYIRECIGEHGLDEHGQIRIDFSGIAEEDDVVVTATEMGFQILYPEDDGEGVLWLIWMEDE